MHVTWRGVFAVAVIVSAALGSCSQQRAVSFARASSPDGTWSVMLWKEWNLSVVVVYVEAFDSKGRSLGKKEVGVFENWGEPDGRLSKVYCSNVEMRCGNPDFDRGMTESSGGKTVIRKSAFFDGEHVK